MEKMENDRIMKEEKNMGKKITPILPFSKKIRITPNSYPNLKNIIHPPNYILVHSKESNMNKASQASD